MKEQSSFCGIHAHTFVHVHVDRNLFESGDRANPPPPSHSKRDGSDHMLFATGHMWSTYYN